jgi:hypothetical protein
MECRMEHVNVGPDVSSRPLAVSHASIKEQSAQYTPGDFLKEAGTFIAVCLGLTLLANVLVLIVG